LRRYRALVKTCRVVLRKYRALLRIYRVVLIKKNMPLLRIFGLFCRCMCLFGSLKRGNCGYIGLFRGYEWLFDEEFL